MKELTPVIERYIETGNTRDEDGFVDCFASDAVVFDESQNHVGSDQIRAWYRRTREEYDFTAKPIQFSEQGEVSTLICTVSGNFPGSPVDLAYRFKLAAGKIVELHID